MEGNDNNSIKEKLRFDLLCSSILILILAKIRTLLSLSSEIIKNLLLLTP